MNRINKFTHFLIFSCFLVFLIGSSYATATDVPNSPQNSYSGVMSTQYWAYPTFQVLFCSPVIGDFDFDGNVEIVFEYVDGSNVCHLTCIYGKNYSLKWDTNLLTLVPIQSPIIAADIIGDQTMELITLFSNGSIIAYSGKNGSFLWEIKTITNSPISVGDVDGDENLEIVVNGFNGSMNCFDGTGKSKYSNLNNPNSFTTFHQMTLLDVDNDTQTEIIAVSGNKIISMSGANGAIKWMSTPVSSGIISSAIPLDINHDGKIEIVFGSSDGFVNVINGINGVLLWSKNVTYNPNTGLSNYYSTFLIGDVNQDNQYEIFFSSSAGKYGCLNATGDILWIHNSTLTIQSLGCLADFDGDLEIEVIFAANSSIFCVDATTGNTEWTFPTTTHSPGLVECADVDGDGKLELIFGFYLSPKITCLIGAGNPWMIPGPVPCFGGSNFHTGDFQDSDKDLIPNQLERTIGTNPNLNDTDTDNLTDNQEIFHATNPFSNDTDTDEMADGWELTNLFDPLNATDADLDADNDHFSNKQEFKAGTNPHDSDTDADYWPDGWDLYPLDALKPNLYVGGGLAVVIGIGIIRFRIKHPKSNKNIEKASAKDTKKKSKK